MRNCSFVKRVVTDLKSKNSLGTNGHNFAITRLQTVFQTFSANIYSLEYCYGELFNFKP